LLLACDSAKDAQPGVTTIPSEVSKLAYLNSLYVTHQTCESDENTEWKMDNELTESNASFSSQEL
jgi:hypothetical protein